MSLATTIAEEFAALLARSSDADKIAMLAELARHLLGRQRNGVSLPVEDASGLVGYLVSPDMPQPNYDPARDTPEFWAELQRRVNDPNPEAVLSAEEVRELFGCPECAGETSPCRDTAEDDKGAA